MKQILTLSALVLLYSCTPNPKNTNIMAIEGVGVVDVLAGKILKNQTVLFNDESIIAVGDVASVTIPKGVNRISGKGRYLIPGLWDMHTHTSGDSVTRQTLFPLFIANGITGIRNMKSDCYDTEGDPCEEWETTASASLKWETDRRKGKLLAPRMILGSELVHGPPPGKPSTTQDPGTYEHGKAHTRLVMERGLDFVKPYDMLPREAYFGIMEVAREEGFVVAGHVPLSVSVVEASEAGQHSIEHCCEGNILEECSDRREELEAKIKEALLKEKPQIMPLLFELMESYNASKCDAVFAVLAKNNTWFTPTLVVTEQDYPDASDWRKDKRLPYVPRVEREFWEDMDEYVKGIYGSTDTLRLEQLRSLRYDIVKTMQEQGVGLLAGSDCGDAGVFWGWSLHEELALLVKAGLTEAQALLTATLHPAQYAGLQDSLGQIKPGMKAELLLLEGNPLSDITQTQNIQAVITQGKVWHRRALDSILQRVAEVND